MLIEKYVVDKKSKYNLTLKQARFLLSWITIAMIFKVIEPSDINYKDDKIQDIKGIHFKNKHLVFKYNLFRKKLKITLEEKHEKKGFEEYWNKFIQNLQEK